MRKAFLEYLATSGIASMERLDDFRNLVRGAREPIGSIAFSYGMITGGDIDVILDEQRREYRPFGKIAMEMGMLSRPQLEMLLQIQRMRGAVATAEALALAGVCSVDEIMLQLGRFFVAQQSAPVCAEA